MPRLIKSSSVSATDDPKSILRPVAAQKLTPVQAQSFKDAAAAALQAMKDEEQARLNEFKSKATLLSNRFSVLNQKRQRLILESAANNSRFDAEQYTKKLDDFNIAYLEALETYPTQVELDHSSISEKILQFSDAFERLNASLTSLKEACSRNVGAVASLEQELTTYSTSLHRRSLNKVKQSLNTSSSGVSERELVMIQRKLINRQVAQVDAKSSSFFNAVLQNSKVGLKRSLALINSFVCMKKELSVLSDYLDVKASLDASYKKLQDSLVVLDDVNLRNLKLKEKQDALSDEIAKWNEDKLAFNVSCEAEGANSLVLKVHHKIKAVELNPKTVVVDREEFHLLDDVLTLSGSLKALLAKELVSNIPTFENPPYGVHSVRYINCRESLTRFEALSLKEGMSALHPCKVGLNVWLKYINTGKVDSINFLAKKSNVFGPFSASRDYAEFINTNGSDDPRDQIVESNRVLAYRYKNQSYKKVQSVLAKLAVLNEIIEESNAL